MYIYFKGLMNVSFIQHGLLNSVADVMKDVLIFTLIGANRIHFTTKIYNIKSIELTSL